MVSEISDKPLDRRLHSCFGKLEPVPAVAADGLARQHQAFGYRAEEPIEGLFRSAC